MIEFEIPKGRGGTKKVTFTGDAHDKNWALQANCAGIQPDFLYESGAAQADAVKFVCRRSENPCPVQLPCLIEALQTGDEWGVQGGLNERDRRAFARINGQRLLDLVAAEEVQIRTEALERNNHPENFTHLGSIREFPQNFQPIIGLEPPEQQSA